MEAKKYCMRCGMHAQLIDQNGFDACGWGCYELLMITSPNKNKNSLYSDAEFAINKLLGGSVQGVQDALDNIVRRGDYVRINDYSRYYPEHDTWVLELNKYQRDNLLWLFNAIGYCTPDSPVEPFHFANTGDWTGEIPYMLAKPGKSCCLDENDHSNRSIADLRKAVEDWVKSKK